MQTINALFTTAGKVKSEESGGTSRAFLAICKRLVDINSRPLQVVQALLWTVDWLTRDQRKLWMKERG